jgi:hypothetical protein
MGDLGKVGSLTCDLFLEDEMTEQLSATFAKLLTAALVAIGCLAISAAAASATEVVYNNLNTVAPTVNGHPNEDTFSLSPENFPVGGLVEFPHTRDNVLKTLITQVDNFTCEHGSYNLENCYTLHPNKKMKYQMTAEIYAVNANNEPTGAPIAKSVETMKIPYRPTTKVDCPATGEGKGFGVNCDVGGVLATVKFKHFTPTGELLPVRAAIMVSGAAEPNKIVNIGLQSSYKEFAGGEYIAEGPADGGVPEVGSDPLPNAIYIRNELNEEEWEGFQPVFEVVAKA